MATVVPTETNPSGVVAITETTLDGSSDTFTYKQNAKQRLVLRNDTAGALSPVIDGDGATSVGIDGIGAVDVSAGFAVGSIGIAEVVSINTDSIREYLKGTIDITGGTGLVAILMEG